MLVVSVMKLHIYFASYKMTYFLLLFYFYLAKTKSTQVVKHSFQLLQHFPRVRINTKSHNFLHS